MKDIVFKTEDFLYNEKQVRGFSLSVGEVGIMFSPFSKIDEWLLVKNEVLFYKGNFLIIENIFNRNGIIKELQSLLSNYGNNYAVISKVYELLPFLKNNNVVCFNVFERVLVNIIISFLKYDIVVFYTDGLSEYTKYRLIKTVYFLLSETLKGKSCIIIETGDVNRKISEFNFVTLDDTTVIENEYNLFLSKNNSNWKLKE